MSKIIKVKKPTGPVANRKLPEGKRWKTYNGKFVTFKKDGEIYYVHFQYSFLKGIHNIAVVASFGDDCGIVILDYYADIVQRFLNQMDTLCATLFPRQYKKRHPELFSTKL